MASLSDLELLEAVRRRMERSIALTRGEMKRGLGSLASIASTALFLGFFGTCIGIMFAFQGCSGEKWACLAATVKGISEGLAPTALGLMVAIPAWWGYRYLSNCVDAFEVEMENISGQLLDCLLPKRRLTARVE
jgi:biopolymer transport protein ExbB/TolQ